jgi:hypothetical protein
MSLYVCSKCGVIENTALSSYWYNQEHLCSECEPMIKKWHGIFPKEKFNPSKHKLIDGFVERTS